MTRLIEDDVAVAVNGRPGADLDLVDRFESRVGSLFRRDHIGDAHPESAARLMRSLLEKYGVESRQLRQFLCSSGLRDSWNDVLAHKRAEVLADWLEPHLKPPVLDILAGDCTPARALVRRGVEPYTATERVHHYPDVDWSRVGVRFEPFDESTLATTTARTVLLSAVLHHENDPAALLASLPDSVERIVVVENPITPTAEPDFHEYMDVFFNRSLNDFGASCTAEHRAPEEWVRFLSAYGRVTIHERHESIPGIPFPYELLVVERS